MKSKTQQIKKHLERYKKITSWTAIEKYRATRLSSIIYELKNRYGMNIKTEMVYENKTNYGVYRLVK